MLEQLLKRKKELRTREIEIEREIQMINEQISKAKYAKIFDSNNGLILDVDLLLQVDQMGFTTRTRNTLKRKGVFNIGDLVRFLKNGNRSVGSRQEVGDETYLEILDKVIDHAA